MPLVLDLPDSQVAALKAKAASAGLTLEEWFSQLATEAAVAQEPRQSGDDIVYLQKTNPREWARQFRAWADGHSATIPILSDEAMSRESIYPDPA